MNKTIKKKNTTIMRVVFFIFVSILIFLMVILFGIKFKVLCLFHSKNKGIYYTLNHELFSLLQGKVLILEDGGYSIIIHKNKILPKNTKEGFGAILGKELIKFLKVKRVDVYIDTTKVKDAMITALVGGGINSFAGIISAILNNKMIDSEFHISNDKSSGDFTFAVDLNIKISLLKFLIAYIRAEKLYNLTYKKEEKYA